MSSVLGALGSAITSSRKADEFERRLRRGRLVVGVGWFGAVASAVGLGLSVAKSGGSWGLAAGGLALSITLVNWTRVWIKESKEPFQFTCSVEAFDLMPAEDVAGDDAKREPLPWLTRDLAEKLSDRVGGRLSLLDTADADGETAAQSSHISVRGWYGFRRAEQVDGCDARWLLEVVPEVRIGGPKAPAKVAQTVRYELPANGGGAPPGLSRDEYEMVFERVYWSVASRIYAEIRRGVEEKIRLLPPGRLRAAAYLNEADDYATSNTLDAYGAARELYGLARVAYDAEYRHRDPAASMPQRWFASAGCLLYRGARRCRSWATPVWPRFGRRALLTARAEIGYVRMLLAEWHLAQLVGTAPRPIFEAKRDIGDAIRRLAGLSRDVAGQHDALFRAYVTEAVMHAYLGDREWGRMALRRALDLRPSDAEDDAAYVFAEGLIEPARLRQQRLLRHAVELDPGLEVAQFQLAVGFDEVWRARPEFEEEVAEMVDAEYRAVIALNPGNIAAWANRGYIAWLLAGDPEHASWSQRASRAFATGRQYKEVKREALVSELDYGLARLAAEDGRFADAYRHYLATVSTQLAEPETAFYEYYWGVASEALLKRFDRYRGNVNGKIDEAGESSEQARLARSVAAFVANDCGLASTYYQSRSGDTAAFEHARDAFEEARRLNRAFVLPAFNLAALHSQLWLSSDGRQMVNYPPAYELSVDTDPLADAEHATQDLARAIELLDEVQRREPSWLPAQLKVVELQAERAVWLAWLRKRTVAHVELVEQSLRGPAVPGAAPLDDPERRHELEARERSRAKLAELDSEREACHDKLARVLRGLLPHPRLGGDVIDAKGTHVADLMTDSTIRWDLDFNVLQVRALIQWARVLALDFESATAAHALCTLLRREYFRTDWELLVAHRQACLALVFATEDGPRRGELMEVVGDCERIMASGIVDYLRGDPAYDSVLRQTVLLAGQGEDAQRIELLENALVAPDVSPATLLWIGDELQQALRPELAEEAYGAAAKMGTAADVQQARLRLGDLLRDRDEAAAISSWSRVIESGTPADAADAAVRLGPLHVSRGDAGAARRIYKRVRDLGDAGAAALLDRAAGLDSGSQAELLRVLTDGPRDVAASAALRLGFLAGPGTDEAERAFRRAMESEKPDVRDGAALALARSILARGGPGDEAERLLAEARASADDYVKLAAALSLADATAARDPKRAIELYREAAASPNGVEALEAVARLGGLLEAQGDLDDATASYRRYAESGAASSYDILALGDRLRQLESRDSAEYVYGLCVENHGAFAPDAMLRLGELHEQRDDALAELLYWQAIESEDMTVAPAATGRLLGLLKRTGRTAEVHATLDRVLTALGYVGVGSAGELAKKLRDAGDEDAATLVETYAKDGNGRSGIGRLPGAAGLRERIRGHHEDEPADKTTA